MNFKPYTFRTQSLPGGGAIAAGPMTVRGSCCGRIEFCEHSTGIQGRTERVYHGAGLSYPADTPEFRAILAAWLLVQYRDLNYIDLARNADRSMIVQPVLVFHVPASPGRPLSEEISTDVV